MKELTTAFDGDTTITELPATSLTVALSRAEIDSQIATAKNFPRVPATKASGEIYALATIDDETAEANVYALPRGGKPIRGPSIRFAEIVAQVWGNNRHDARISHINRVDKYVEADAYFVDLERNTITMMHARRRIFDSKGRIFTDDMILVTGQAAMAIARREAILKGVPQMVWRRGYEESLKIVRESDAGGKTLIERRDQAIKHFAQYGKTAADILEALGVERFEDIGVDELATLKQMASALKGGDASLEELFPAKKTEPGATDLKGRMAELAAKSEERQRKEE